MLPSGIKVTSIDAKDVPVATVGVVVKSGAGHESYENLGVSHALRANIGQSTKNVTSFGVVRNIQQTGGRFDVVGTRDYTMYTISAPKNSFREVADFFVEAVSAPAFKHWEQGDIVHNQMTLDLAGVSNAARAVELLHKGAFRSGLGNSLYSPDYMVGKHKPDMIKAFHTKTHTPSRTVVVGHGLDHLAASRIGEALKLEKGHGRFSSWEKIKQRIKRPSSPGPDAAHKFYGDEIRSEVGGPQAFVAIATETSPAGNAKDAVTCMLLKNILGNGVQVGRGRGSGKLDKAVANISGSKAVSGIHYSYSDASLTGAFVACDAGSAGQVS